jgi:hypothetical protein
MGCYLSVNVRFGAIFTESEVKKAGHEEWWDEGAHPYVSLDDVSDYAGAKYTRTYYLWVRGSYINITGTGGADNDPRGVEVFSKLGKCKIPEETMRKNFHYSCEELKFPYREPEWMLVWNWS